jgi:hypothetical protein
VKYLTIYFIKNINLNIQNYILYFNFFNNKINHNKIYDFSKNILNKINDQTLQKVNGANG